MPRITYVPQDLSQPQAIVNAIRTRRGGNLLNLDRMLLHSPPFAKGWNSFLGEVRTGLELDPKLRELAICLVALLNGAEYEFHHHAPEFLQGGGTEEQLDALKRNDAKAHLDSVFDQVERAVIAYTAALTRDVAVPEDVFTAMRQAVGSDRGAVELTGVIATYNMVSRFLVALNIQPEPVKEQEVAA